MGHYDEQYEADANRTEKAARETLTKWIHKEIARDNARAEADKLKERQVFKATVKKWINEKLDTMEPEDINFMYTMSAQVPELRAFFKVFK